MLDLDNTEADYRTGRISLRTPNGFDPLAGSQEHLSNKVKGLADLHWGRLDITNSEWDRPSGPPKPPPKAPKG